MRRDPDEERLTIRRFSQQWRRYSKTDANRYVPCVDPYPRGASACLEVYALCTPNGAQVPDVQKTHTTLCTLLLSGFDATAYVKIRKRGGAHHSPVLVEILHNHGAIDMPGWVPEKERDRYLTCTMKLVLEVWGQPNSTLPEDSVLTPLAAEGFVQFAG